MGLKSGAATTASEGGAVGPRGIAATGAYVAGSMVDVAWFSGMVVIGLGALSERPLPAVAAAGPYIGRCWQFAAPACLVLLMGVIVWVVPLAQTGRSPLAGEAALALGICLLMTRYLLGYRDRVRAHDLLVREAAEREAAQVAREEAARLEGVLLTARELAHLLNNDLAIVVGNVGMLGLQPVMSADEREALLDAEEGLERMAENLVRLQQVSRVETRETPVGPVLDLARSSAC